MGEIRHIAADERADACFATAAFESLVTLWSFEERQRVASLETVLDFGGHRLALCGRQAQRVVAAGAWERHGVCGYSGQGERLWQRKDLRQPQQLASAAGGDQLVACRAEGAAHVLRAVTGETVTTLRGVRKFFPSRFGDVGVVVMSANVGLIDSTSWTLRWKTPIQGFGVLAAASAEGAVAVSEVAAFGGGTPSSVVAYNLAGELLWRWEAAREVICPALAWDGDASEWVGVLNHVNNKEPHTLVRWSPDGELKVRIPLKLYSACEFLPSGRFLVTSDAEVRETTTGEVAWHLPVDDGG